MDKTRIGPSGNSKIFYDNGYTKSIQAPQFLKNVGLGAYEYSFGRGFTMSEQTAIELGKNARQNDIALSIHAPYYINFANPSPEMIQKSIGYVLRGIQFMDAMQACKMVVHPAAVGNATRTEALAATRQNLCLLLQTIADKNIDMTGKYICLETMGKFGQIGTYQEVIELCKLSDFFIPTFDFGHINCILQGGLDYQKYQEIFSLCLSQLGKERTKNCHIHFSKIQYGPKGEIKHLSLDDTVYGPEFEPLAKTIKSMSLTPTIICESSQTMMEDAIILQKIFDNTKV